MTETRILRRNRNIFTDKSKKTFRRAFDRQTKILAETSGQAYNDTNTYINMSDLYSVLIKTAGRIADNYASDIIADIEAVKSVIATCPKAEENFTDIIPIGFRKMGADGTSSIMHNLTQSLDFFTGYIYPERYYHTIMAIEIECEVTTKQPEHRRNSVPYVRARLKDITHELHSVAISDLPEDMKSSVKYTETKPYVPDGVPGNHDERMDKLREFYADYQRYWIYANRVSLEHVTRYYRANWTFNGIKADNGSVLQDFHDFKKTTVLDIEFMRSILTPQNFQIYEIMMNDIYLGTDDESEEGSDAGDS